MNKVDNVYVINMKESEGRLEGMTAQIPNIGKGFIRIDAVNGSKLSKEQVKDTSTLLCGKLCTNGMIGCFLSHKKTWETVIKNGDKYALIMEDDCQLEPNFSEKLKLCLDELDGLEPEWDIFYCGCFGGCKPNKNYTIFQKINIFFANKLKQASATNSAKHVYVPESPLGTHCYIISNRCARNLVKHLDKVSYHVDLEMIRISKKHNLKVFASKEMLAYQYSTSDSSTLTQSKFPLILNKIIDPIIDDYRISYSYYLSTPFMEIAYFPINLYFVILLSSLFFMPKGYSKNYMYCVIAYLMLELTLSPKNYYIISVWLLCTLLITYKF
jgi:GR25 family glycosyltransferase involved in LPS biosynthesis